MREERIYQTMKWAGFIVAMLAIVAMFIGCGGGSPASPSPIQTPPVDQCRANNGTPSPSGYFCATGVFDTFQLARTDVIWVHQAACLNVKPTLLMGFDVVFIAPTVKDGIPGFWCGSVWAAGCTVPWAIQVENNNYFEHAFAHEVIHAAIYRDPSLGEQSHTNPLFLKCDPNQATHD